MPLLLGVFMGVAGLAVLVTGKIILPGGRVIAGRRARRAGGVWLSFLPLAFFVSFVMELFGLENFLDRRLTHWVVVMLCLFVGLGFLLPAWSSAPPRRRQPRPKKAKVLAAKPIAPATKPPSLVPEPESRLPRSEPAQHVIPLDKNPFDFS